MAACRSRRRRLVTALADADTGQLATKADLEGFRADVRTEVETLRADVTVKIEALRGEFKALNGKVNSAAGLQRAAVVRGARPALADLLRNAGVAADGIHEHPLDERTDAGRRPDRSARPRLPVPWVGMLQRHEKTRKVG